MTLFERYITGDTSASAVYGAWWYAQTFTIGNTGANETHDVVGVQLRLYRVGSPGTGTVAIYTVVAGKPGEVTSATVDYNFNTLVEDAPGTWVAFNFAVPATLEASTQYAIVVKAPDGDGDNFVYLRNDPSSPTYTGGSVVYSWDSGDNWAIDTSRDYVFEEYDNFVLSLLEIITSTDSTWSFPSVLRLLEIITVFEEIDLLQVPLWISEIITSSDSLSMGTIKTFTELITSLDDITRQHLKTLAEIVTLSDYVFYVPVFTAVVLSYVDQGKNLINLTLKVQASIKLSLDDALKYAGQVANFNPPFGTFKNFDSTAFNNNLVGFNITNCPVGLESLLTLIISNYKSKIMPGIPFYIFEISGYKWD